MHPSQLAAIMTATGDPSYRSDGSRRSRQGGYHRSPSPTRQMEPNRFQRRPEGKARAAIERAEKIKRYKPKSLPTGVTAERMADREVRVDDDTGKFTGRPPEYRTNQWEHNPRYRPTLGSESMFEARSDNEKLERGFDPLREWIILDKMEKVNRLVKGIEGTGDYDNRRENKPPPPRRPPPKGPQDKDRKGGWWGGP